MGERGRLNEDATADDLEVMGRIVAEALDAGAVGFSTSRTIGHRSLWGEPVPGTFAADEELLAIADHMRRVGKGVFEMIPAGTVGKLEALGGERTTQEAEHDLMRRFSLASGRPVTFTLVQSPDYDPDLWREILRLTADANGAGAQLFPQVSSRPIGFLTGLSGYHAFMRKPTYLEQLADLPLAERVVAMRDPEMKARLLGEPDVRPEEPGSMENVYGLFTRAAPVMYPMDNPVELEPAITDTIGARAAAAGQRTVGLSVRLHARRRWHPLRVAQCGRRLGSDERAARDVGRSQHRHGPQRCGCARHADLRRHGPDHSADLLDAGSRRRATADRVRRQQADGAQRRALRLR